MRLCNAGEMLSIYSYLANFPDIARVQATKIEVLIRSIYTIADQPLISAEALAQYNDTHKSQLTTLDFLRQWVGNLEQVVIDRLDMVYGGLQLKQERQLQGISLCANCENQFTEVPEGSKTLKYSLAEIVCHSCVKALTDFSDFDFGETIPSQEPSISTEEIASFKCPDCQEELPDRESFNSHRSTCQGTSTV
jgi:ribosomal protein L37AE/L43A